MTTSNWIRTEYMGLAEEVEIQVREAWTTHVEAAFDGVSSWALRVHRTGREDSWALRSKSLAAMADAYERQMGFKWTTTHQTFMNRLLKKYWEARLAAVA